MNSLDVLDFTHSFSSFQAVRDLRFSIRPGEIYGLVGPDGAGKTTTLRVCAGVMCPTQGTIRVLGHDPLQNGSGVRQLLGYMPQKYGLYGDLSVAENLQFFGELYGVPTADFCERSRRLLGLTRLDSFRERPASALSGGMYKKLALACALLHTPRLLILDEPTNGVDPVSRAEIFDLLAEFCREGTSILLSTTYMDEASRCSRVGLLHKGNLMAEGALPELLAGFTERVLSLDRKAAQVHDILLPFADRILSVSPMGCRTRLVVLAHEVEALVSSLRRSRIGVEDVPPSLEDLLFTLIRRETP